MMRLDRVRKGNVGLKKLKNFIWKMTKLVQCVAPRGQKYQREVIVGQSLYKKELLRGRESLQTEWLKYKVSLHCNCSKRGKNHLYEKLGQEQKK